MLLDGDHAQRVGADPSAAGCIWLAMLAKQTKMEEYPQACWAAIMKVADASPFGGTKGMQAF
jgi:hypothetical protein